MNSTIKLHQNWWRKLSQAERLFAVNRAGFPRERKLISITDEEIKEMYNQENPYQK